MNLIGLTDTEYQYVEGRLDHEHIEELAAKARLAIGNGQTPELCYQPGDGTWYSLTIVPLGTLLGANGGGTGGQTPTSYLGSEYMIVYAQRGTIAPYTPGDDLEWIVSTKLTDNKASAVAIAALLKAIFEGGSTADRILRILRKEQAQ